MPPLRPHLTCSLRLVSIRGRESAAERPWRRSVFHRQELLGSQLWGGWVLPLRTQPPPGDERQGGLAMQLRKPSLMPASCALRSFHSRCAHARLISPGEPSRLRPRARSQAPNERRRSRHRGCRQAVDSVHGAVRIRVMMNIKGASIMCLVPVLVLSMTLQTLYCTTCNVCVVSAAVRAGGRDYWSDVAAGRHPD